MSEYITKQFNYRFKNTVFEYTIAVNRKLFRPGADALAYTGVKDTPIATISFESFSLALYAIGNVHLINHSEGISYVDEVPQYLIPLMDINAEYNLNNYGISIEDRNHFEYILLQKDEYGFLTEQSIEFYKELVVLDSSIDSTIEDLNSTAILLIQGNFLTETPSISESELLIQDYAIDDFEEFASLNAIEAYIPSI